MIKIHEIQRNKYNPRDKQERVIEYSSWENYCKDISTFDGMRHMMYPSIPRQTLIENINLHNLDEYTINDLIVYLEFFNVATGKTIIHEAVEIIDCPACTAEGKSSYMCETCYGRGYVENV